MAETIDRESTQREKLAIDINFMGDRYKTSNELFTFPSPTLETLDKNLFFLLRNSKEIEFDQKYKYRPDYLSFDEYGTVALAHMLMYINAVSSIEQFDLTTVVVPEYSAVIDIIKDKFSVKETEDLIEVDW